jgi:hypothetical protein
MQTKTHNFSSPESGVLAEQITGTDRPLFTYGYPGEEDRSQPGDSGREQWPERDPFRPREPANEWSDRIHDPAGDAGGTIPDERRDVWDRL